MAGVSDPLTWGLIAGGIVIGGGIGAMTARRIHMTDMPQLVAFFHSLVGLAAVLVAGAAFYSPAAFGIGAEGAIRMQSLIEMSLGVAIGAITFAGSIIAFAKLNGNMSGAPIILPMRHALNILIFAAIVALIVCWTMTQQAWTFWAIAGLSFVFGITLIIPIGGADMPVVVSMLQFHIRDGRRRRWAFHAGELGADHHRRAGRLVGRDPQLHHVQGHEPQLRLRHHGRLRAARPVDRSGQGRDASGEAGLVRKTPPFIMEEERGQRDHRAGLRHGGQGAGAAHAVREMAAKLKKEGVKVSYAIHPVAGRMPGHMNVLLAEANVPYDEVFELEDINSQFAQADVAYVIGANDVTNPSAKTDPKSPIYGMPILDVEKKPRPFSSSSAAMGSGYAWAFARTNSFFRDNTMMLFGDAKKMTEEIVKGAGLIRVAPFRHDLRRTAVAGRAGSRLYEHRRRSR